MNRVGTNEVEQKRHKALLDTLRPLRPLFAGKKVLDFGASSGLSALALMQQGAKSVFGVEPDEERVRHGQIALRHTEYDGDIELVHVADTRNLHMVRDQQFDVVFANAVFEHIPQPRHEHLREVWRVLAIGGYLIINETPNKYLPVDFHTLHLPLTNWLPSRVAHSVGILSGRFAQHRGDWSHSGWRGLGHYELYAGIRGSFKALPELSRVRHRVLHKLGLPSSLLDPYPTHILEKVS